MKKVGRASLGLVLERDTRRHRGKDQIIDPNGKRFVAVNLSACGENVGLAEKLIKIIPREHPEPGEYPYRKQLYVHLPFSTKEEAVAAIAAHRPETTPTQQPQGGKREPCRTCGGTKTKTITVCADCGTALDDEVKPQDAGYRLTHTEAITDTPAPEGEVSPQVAVLPAHLPRCLNYRPGGTGCHHRVDRRGDRYCGSCAAESYANLPATAYGFAAAGD